MRRGVVVLIALASLVGPQGAIVASAQDDWGVTRDRRPPRDRSERPPRDRALRDRARRDRARPDRTAPPPAPTDRGELLLERYLRVLEAEPADGFALDRLLELTRARDGSVDALVAALAARVESEPAPYAPRMLLGHVQRRLGRAAAARAHYEAALRIRSEEPLPHVALARVLREERDAAGATAQLEQALALARTGPLREEILRELATIALEQGDVEGARRHYDALARGAPGGLYPRSELARALLARGQHELAVAEYERIARSTSGDRRALAPVLVELARAQLGAGRTDDAIASLERAISAAGGASGIRAEGSELMLEAYRRAGRLEELAAQLERRPGGADGALLLGRVHDELGHDELALAAYRRALRSRPRDVDLRLRVIQVLGRAGRMDELVTEYRALVRSVPGEPRYLVELAELLRSHGGEQEAIAALEDASRRSREPTLHQRLAELYARWGDAERAERELAEAVRLDPGDPIHLVALGSQRFEQGDRAGALATWRRILSIGGASPAERAAAHVELGAILADHDLLPDAIAALEEAVRLAPGSIDAVRGLASVLERADREADAEARWREVLRLAGDDRAARREAREHVVGIWARGRALERHAAELARAFAAEPPDLEAGHLLAEVHRRRRDLEASEAVLARLGELEPRDVDTLHALERVRTQAGDLAGAIAILRRLVDADPRRASGYLGRMAEHALALYRDDEALGYAREAAERNPDDAGAHRRFGDLARARQDAPGAIAGYRRALELDDRLFDVAFALAELHLARAEVAEADAIYRSVLARAPDDDLVARAARASMQIHVGAGTLEQLEHELLPLALAHPERPVYRRAVVEIYDAIASPLLARSRRGGEEGDAARAALRRYGARALKPLLEALHDDQQRGIALAILGPLGNPAAAQPLLAIAERSTGTDAADADTRVLAVLAAAALLPSTTARAPSARAGTARGSADLAARIARLSAEPEPRVRAAATFALARLGGSVAPLRARLSDDDPTVRGWAAIGLGARQDRASLAAIRALLGDPRPDPRAAAALALGWLGDVESAPRIAVLGPGPLEQVAMTALGALDAEPARAALVGALFDPDAAVARAAALALRGGSIPRDALPVPRPGEAPLGWAVRAAREPGAPLARPDLAALAPAIGRAVHDAIVEGPAARTQAALGVLAGEPGAIGPIGLGELTRDAAAWPEPERAIAELTSLAARLRDDLVLAAGSPDAAVRADAVRALARDDDPRALAVVAEGLVDPAAGVRRAALDALASGAPASELARERLVAMLEGDLEWATRTRAARALGRIALARGAGAEPALVSALASDAFAFVREAAARALAEAVRAGVASDEARAALARAAESDVEPAVRAAAGAGGDVR